MTNKKTEELLRKLPSVDALLKNEAIAKLTAVYPRNLLKLSIQATLTAMRQEVLDGIRHELPDVPDWERIISRHLQHDVQFSLQRVINATGIVLHTNLGRSLLSPDIEEHVIETAGHYTNLEYDLETGKRGARYDHLVTVIKQLTGAEDVLVVNNNAAAVFLALHTLAYDKEVIISRGELVEIGGYFRIPEVIALSKGTIHEVGTTNKTHAGDYQAAMGSTTGAIMKVHRSNYRIIGFTESVGSSELAKIAHAQDIPLICDLGSGLFVDMRQFGLPYEPTVRETLQYGCDVVMFSGDKLLGGPQAGIIVGRKKYLAAMKQNQLLRALRVDKMTIAALEATLRLYLDEKQAVAKIPTVQMLALTEEECMAKAEQLAQLLQSRNLPCAIAIVADNDAVGGGAYPEYALPGYAVTLQSEAYRANALETELRHAAIPVIARIKNDKVCLDVRTIAADEFELIATAVEDIFKS